MELSAKAIWVREQTLLLHQYAPGTRVASSLSPVEFLVSLYYGGYLRHRPQEPRWAGRDRLIMSKGHGLVSLYPILADCGYFPMEELPKIATQQSYLGVIPDAGIPGVETTNGALGHGLGVGAGMAIALKAQGSQARVCVVCGDGEMNEGSVWEAIMFAPKHGLNNLMLVIDDNKISMLGFQREILNLSPFVDKLSAFGWDCHRLDGHDMAQVQTRMQQLWLNPGQRPCAVVLDTVKGKGVAALENRALSHVLSLSHDQVETAIQELRP
ncbi:transketolase subunit A [Magnetococcus marinus MC-1]|uniref:Transketolase subunit A n=2 Tax=Magnetococcus TaxID=162171 RepID=A0L593_MAGMM|nr:transketolase subunit A [Magnetococcus marinus MC-1]